MIAIDRLFVFGVGSRKNVRAVISRDEKEIAVLFGFDDRSQRCGSWIGDGPGRKSLVAVGVVGVFGIQEMRPCQVSIEIFDAIDDGGIRGEGNALFEAVVENRGDTGSLLGCGGLLCDDRGENHDVAHGEPPFSGCRFDGFPVAKKLPGQNARYLGGRETSGKSVGLGEKEALHRIAR